MAYFSTTSPFSRQFLTITALFFSLTLHGQMWNGQDSLYGNEWIRYEQSYYKFKVAEDGLYRLSYETMRQAGIPLETVAGQQFQLFRLGQEVPVYATTAGLLAPGDFLEFYGERNRSELDRHLFADPDAELLNPEYSLYTDSSTYFLTWTTGGSTPLRYVDTPNDLSNPPAAEGWYWAESKQVFTEQHYKAYEKWNGVNVYYSRFGGDGFGHALAEETLLTLDAAGRAAGGPAASLQISLIGNANAEGHALELTVNNSTVQVDTFFGAQLRKYEIPLEVSGLTDQLAIRVRGTREADRYGIAFGQLRFPRSFAFAGEDFLTIELPAAAGPRYLELSGLGNAPLTVYEPAAGLRLTTIPAEGRQRLLLPARSGPRKLVLSRSTAISNISRLSPIAFVDYEAGDIDYLILTSDRLFDDGSGNNWVQAYADYRSGPEGGNFRVQIVEVRQLFEQFGYGIDYHPLSIRNAIHFFKKNKWPGLQNCFIIGRGQEYPFVRSGEALRTAEVSGNMLIPTFGYPASDNLLLASPGARVSIVPLGRLAAINGREVRIYLDKVKALESAEQLPQTVADRAWTKHILHLGGGGTAGEQSSIRFYLEGLAEQIETSTFGGSVRAFYKNSTDVIQNSLSQEIFDYINRGTSIITFFGHSSPGTFDFNIDNPDNYDNQGRYPMILSLGCYSGNLFGTGRSIGERFTFYENKAAAIFGASRGLGFINDLARFARTFYQNIGEDYYGRSVGEAMQATYRTHASNNWIGIATLVEQFTIHGDPAIRLHPADGPDYVVDAAGAGFSPQLVSTQLDSFTFNFDVVNLGTNELDTVRLALARTFPDGQREELLQDSVVMDRFRRQLSYTLPVGGSRATGQNLLHVTLDSDNLIVESPAPAAEQNNELVRSNGEPGVPLIIIDNTARAVYPPEFALIGDPNITLKASTTNALAPERSYWLEIDTTARFDSPAKIRLTQQQRGGVLKWTPNINWQDGTAYYWRVSPAAGNDNPEPVWSTSSFTYIAGSAPGWRQGHYWQFKENTERDLVFTDSTQTVRFGQEFLDMRVRNKLWDNDDRPGFFYNNDNTARGVRPWLYLDHGVSVMVWQANTGGVVRNTGRQYGSVDGATIPLFTFDTRKQEARLGLIELLTTGIPDGYFVFFFTVQREMDHDYRAVEWAQDSLVNGKNIFNVLEAEGAGLVRQLSQIEPVPYAFMYRKGGEPRDEKLAASISDEINVTTVIPVRFTSGKMVSRRIGPAAAWSSLSWNVPATDGTSGDTVQVNVLGIRDNNMVDTLIRKAQTGQSLSDIDAAIYPYLQLQYAAKDPTDRSLLFPESWTIRYEGPPEFAINPAGGNYYFRADTLPQGLELQLRASVENLSAFPADSVAVAFTLLDAENREEKIRRMLPAIPANGQTTVAFELPTTDRQGRYNLTTEVNPDRRPAEQHYFNNVLNHPFEVITDRKNPLLDVTFDGRVLLDGDLVGAEPFIAIRLRDENPYLLLSDTSLLALQLTHPNGRTERLALNRPEIQYTTAQEAGKNVFTIDYQPTFTEDGTYQLSVNGRDVSGNFSGAVDYRVSFEVRTRNSISNVLNYPNPFSTSTQFVYTLTGTPPAYFKIQILNVSGRVVREITQDEIGPLQVGTHRTEFAWDGTDEFGDRLANGVYLYRMTAKDESGKDFESYDSYVEDTGLSGFFERGFGKMVLLR